MSREVMLKYLLDDYREIVFPMTHIEAVYGIENIYNMIDKNKIEIESLKQEIQELKRKEGNQ
ncbi:hypothetical protein [Staphylococcus auricularis]|uniref:hypothetical protein n=1 Tax=Staphylococcus auricularis TaxID=29379 RepID=UPI000D1BBD7B|nr:hypothetical protein [Staphylococcus auricularis]PTH24747.1 hypothetical protein BU608_09650 [Staphylococcus auricularis]